MGLTFQFKITVKYVLRALKLRYSAYSAIYYSALNLQCDYK
jgi:hypothetical protein